MPASPHFEALGDLALHVLLALGDSTSHGYAIGKDVEQRSHGRLKPTTGALYQALKRMRDEGLVEPASAPAGTTDARRKYFRITERGRAAVATEAVRLQELIEAAREHNLIPGRG